MAQKNENPTGWNNGKGRTEMVNKSGYKEYIQRERERERQNERKRKERGLDNVRVII